MNETRKKRDTEQQLSDAITAFADTIHPAPDAYRTAHREWHRRERRRRVILASLIMVVFTLATLIGLWVLNHASPTHSSFSGAVPHSRAASRMSSDHEDQPSPLFADAIGTLNLDVDARYPDGWEGNHVVLEQLERFQVAKA